MADPLIPPDPALLSDADLDLRVGLRCPETRTMREYTFVVDAGARVVWRQQVTRMRDT